MTLQNAHLSFILVSSSKELAFSIYCRTSHGFPLELIAVNHLYNTLPSCANLGSFSMCYLKRSSLSFGARNGAVDQGTALQAGRLRV